MPAWFAKVHSAMHSVGAEIYSRIKCQCIIVMLLFQVMVMAVVSLESSDGGGVA